MRFSISADQMSAAVGYVAKILPRNPSVPVYRGVLLVAEASGTLRVHARELDAVASASSSVTANVTEPGAVLVFGRMLADITSSLSGEVTVFVDGTRLRVHAGSSKFHLPLMPQTDFTVDMATEPVAQRASVDTAALVDAVERVAPAASGNGELPILTGMRLELSREAVTLAATDRYRLATMTLPWTSTLEQDVATTVPAKLLAELVKGLAKDGQTLDVHVEASTLVVSGQSRSFRVGTIDGDYPAWRMLLPKSYVGRATLDVKETLAALHRVALVADRLTPVTLTFHDGLLSLSADGESAGFDEIEVSYDGDPVTIAFNPGFLGDGLMACRSGEAVLSLQAAPRPAVLTSADDQYSYLVTAIRPK